MVEGFWTVQFTDIQGLGFGVVTLLGGRVFGGDSGFLYTGTYTENGNAVNIRVHVRRIVDEVPKVMGLDQFDLELTGKLQGNTLVVTGVMLGTQLPFSGILMKQDDPPTRTISGVTPKAIRSTF